MPIKKSKLQSPWGTKLMGKNSQERQQQKGEQKQFLDLMLTDFKHRYFHTIIN